MTSWSKLKLEEATIREQAREIGQHGEKLEVTVLRDDPRTIAAGALLVDVGSLNTNIANIQKSIDGHEEELKNLVAYQRVLIKRRDALEQIAHELDPGACI